MDFDYMQYDLTSSASSVRITPLVYWSSKGSSTPVSGDLITMGREGTKIHRKLVADRISIWH